ncbi:MAG: YggS family pyridoxal phosphate-dependent enzyme [Leadbetterella sp.]
MSTIASNISEISREIGSEVCLVAVSKFKSADLIMEAYSAGHRAFGENYVQELIQKAEELPKDIDWHFIGHLQSNKVKYIVPFTNLIHSVDSLKLLVEINKQSQKIGKCTNCLLQLHIAKEESKEGLDENELHVIISQLEQLDHVRVCGLMGMATFTENEEILNSEFIYLKRLFDGLKNKNVKNMKMETLSMGMSSDYLLAIKNGSTMIRVGTAIFGSRK